MTASLVLGGSAFVGRVLVEHLVGRGDDVAVLNRGRTPSALPDGVEHVVADRTDQAGMRAALGGRDFDAVYDISGYVMAAGDAGAGGGRTAMEDLVDLLDGHVGSYVYVSSIMAYDQALAGILPWTEDLPDSREAPSVYGGFKAACERTLLAQHRRSGFPAVAVRPAAIYGPHNNVYDMEAAMFLRLEQHRPVLLPHAGLVSASYGHIDDLCEGLLAAALAPHAAGEVINLTAEGVTSRRYVETLAAVVGVEADIVEVPDLALAGLGGPAFSHLFGVRHHAVLGVDKATRLLGVTPRYDLAAGHRHTYEWFGAQGWSGRAEPLVDPVWKASWDFEAEAALAARLR